MIRYEESSLDSIKEKFPSREEMVKISCLDTSWKGSFSIRGESGERMESLLGRDQILVIIISPVVY